MTVIRERVFSLQQVTRVFDTKPWVAHLYVTEQCNLDCHYCNEFNNSKVRLNVSGVLFKDTLDEMAQVIDTCLDLGIPVRARVVHNDLVHDRALRDASESEPLLRFLEQQEKLKRIGQKIRSSWNIITYQKKMLR